MTSEPLARSRLQQFTGSALESEVRSRLAVPPGRVDEHPYLVLVDAYADAAPRLAPVFRNLLHDLVSEVEAWKSHEQANLLAVAQRCAEDLAPAAFQLADRLEPRTEREQEVLAGLLKVLIAGHWLADVPFWRRQGSKLDPSYGALIFSGLVMHGMEAAMHELPALSKDPTAARFIALFIPNLVSEEGEVPVALRLAQRYWDLTEEARPAFRPFLNRVAAYSEEVRALLANPEPQEMDPISKDVEELIYAS